MSAARARPDLNTLPKGRESMEATTLTEQLWGGETMQGG